MEIDFEDAIRQVLREHLTKDSVLANKYTQAHYIYTSAVFDSKDTLETWIDANIPSVDDRYPLFHALIVKVVEDFRPAGIKLAQTIIDNRTSETIS